VPLCNCARHLSKRQPVPVQPTSAVSACPSHFPQSRERHIALFFLTLSVPLRARIGNHLGPVHVSLCTLMREGCPIAGASCACFHFLSLAVELPSHHCGVIICRKPSPISRILALLFSHFAHCPRTNLFDQFLPPFASILPPQADAWELGVRLEPDFLFEAFWTLKLFSSLFAHRYSHARTRGRGGERTGGVVGWWYRMGGGRCCSNVSLVASLPSLTHTPPPLIPHVHGRHIHVQTEYKLQKGGAHYTHRIKLSRDTSATIPLSGFGSLASCIQSRACVSLYPHARRLCAESCACFHPLSSTIEFCSYLM
jgi:hypothetical protein